MRPSPLVINILTKLSKVIPTWKIIPTNDIIDLAFKVPEVRAAVYFLSQQIFTDLKKLKEKRKKSYI